MKHFPKTKITIAVLASLLTVYAMFTGLSIASALTQSGDAYIFLPGFIILYIAFLFVLWYAVGHIFSKLNKTNKDSK